MNLAAATQLAEDLQRALGGATERIAIAGSIRRRKRDVGDIELVAIPRWHEVPRASGQITLGGSPPTEHVNVLAKAVEAFAESGALQVIKPGTHEVLPWELHPEGRYWRLYVPHRDIKVDLFLATPETWGVVYTIRTGSAEFSEAMLARWKQVSGGGRSAGALLWRPAHRTPERTPEEIDVFAACELSWVPPEQRVDARVLHQATRGWKSAPAPHRKEASRP